MIETAQLDAILHGAAFAPITDRAFLRITGSDATRWLNGMVTNNIKDLAPGQGNYNFLLNAQGRIQGDCTIFREPFVEPTFVLETDATQLETVHQLLDKFIIMDDVELTRGLKVEGTTVEKSPRGLTLKGPSATDVLLKTIVARHHFTPFVTPPEPGTITPGRLDICEVVILTPPNISDTYEVWSSSTWGIKELYRVWEFYGANPIAPETLEALRILFATPKYGIDIRNTDTHKDLPQETAQTHALHFAKGCYLGQEIVERIRSRGQVHRTFTRFTLTGSMPSLPAPLEANAKPAGELTSATQIGDTIYALGYIRREILDMHTPVTYPGGTAAPLNPKP
jgi:folate-binding protein YgfZ